MSITYEAKDVLKPKDYVKPKVSFKDEAKAKHEQAFWKIQAKATRAKFSDLISGPLYFNTRVLEVADFEYGAYDVKPGLAAEIDIGDNEAKDTKLEDASFCISCFFSVFKVVFSVFSYCINHMFSVFKAA